MSKLIAFVTAMLTVVSMAQAAVIVNLSASPSDPNAGTASGSYTYNPVILFLQAGTYSVGVVGIAGGGDYDAYTIYAPTPSNGAYTDSYWSITDPTGDTLMQSASATFNTSAGALNYYSALVSLMITLPVAEDVSFSLNDEVFPYFGDDSGGVSLGVAELMIPEPGALVLLGGALAGIALLRGLRGGRAGRSARR